MKELAFRVEIEGGDKATEDRVHLLVDVAVLVIKVRGEDFLQLLFGDALGVDTERFHREFGQAVIGQKFTERLDLLHLA